MTASLPCGARASHGLWQDFLQRFQFAVDRDAQGLEGAGGRVDVTAFAAVLPLDQFSQLPGGLHRPVAPRSARAMRRESLSSP